jgi:hypothetical protein
VAQAQGGGRGRGGAARVMAALDSVKATDAIKAKADSIIKATQAVTAPLMEAARGGDADARTKMTEANTKQNEAIKALLPEADRATFERLTAGGGRRGGGF